MDDLEKFYRKDWMSDDQWLCAQFWADIMGGFHHVSGNFKQCGSGISIFEKYGNFATYDFDGLTRLVFLAHDRCIRVAIDGGGPMGVKFTIHKRHLREGNMSEKHPTIEDAITKWRTK